MTNIAALFMLVLMPNGDGTYTVYKTQQDPYTTFAECMDRAALITALVVANPNIPFDEVGPTVYCAAEVTDY